MSTNSLRVKFSGSILEHAFTVDSNGLLVPKPEISLVNLQSNKQRLSRQLNANTGLWRRMTEVGYNSDVKFTDNPLGNTPVIGAGVKMFGQRPYTRPKSKKGDDWTKSDIDSDMEKRLRNRQSKIERYNQTVYDKIVSLEPENKDSTEYVQWLIEQDQALTGGGFDNNSIGEVHLSALNFVRKAHKIPNDLDPLLSKLIVEGSIKLRDRLVQEGLVLGSLQPKALEEVRFEQDKDGMLGFPLYSKGNAPLTVDLANRLLIETGISTKQFVGSEVTDKYSGLKYPFRVIDALSYVIGNSVFGVNDLQSLVILLARIQKHGYTLKDGKIESKKGKTRSVYPNSAVEAGIEAMIFDPFLDELQQKEVSLFPSLQKRETRVEMITALLEDLASKGYDALAADWSQYDATVVGSIFATVLYYAWRPFYRSEYHEWCDRAIYILTFKSVVGFRTLFDKWEKDIDDGKLLIEEVDQFRLYGLSSGLISGAKATHGGGSMYGLVAYHHVLPKMLGYEPIFGVQAGDDTLLPIPLSYIDLQSQDNTYAPISEAAARLGGELNQSKQIWHVVSGELAKVFLQELYHLATKTYGVGSICRPSASLYMSEFIKNLSISEQMMAEIARMDQGNTSYFVEPMVELWFSNETFLLSLFKEFGLSAFDKLTQSIGLDPDEIAQRIGVGSFSWGIGVDNLRKGDIPILPIMSKVAKEMQDLGDLNLALKSLAVQGRGSKVNTVSDDEQYLDESLDILGD